MEQFRRENPELLQDSKTSSIYSIDSSGNRNSTDQSSSIETPTSSRPISVVRPSYMNAYIPRKSVVSSPKPSAGTDGSSSTQAKQPQSLQEGHYVAPVPESRGTLIVFVAALPHPSLIIYVERLLKRSHHSIINIIGHCGHETVLKQFKMDVYALLGKLRREISVHLKFVLSLGPEEISSAAATTSSHGDDIVHSVLCCPSFPTRRDHPTADVLALDPGGFHDPWISSVGFLHTVARATLPRFPSEDPLPLSTRIFAISGPVDDSRLSKFYNTACDALIDLLSTSSAARGVKVARAETVLVPEPDPEERHEGGNGLRLATPPDFPQSSNSPAFAPAESPTKLWNMWALQDELGDTD